MLAKEDEPSEESQKWQKILYKKIGGSLSESDQPLALIANKDARLSWGAARVCSVAKVVYGMHVVDHPQFFAKNVWKKVISVQRRRAVMACFRMVPLYVLPRHRAINLFLTCYSQMWLETELVETNKLIEYLTTNDDSAADGSKTSAAATGTGGAASGSGSSAASGGAKAAAGATSTGSSTVAAIEAPPSGESASPTAVPTTSSEGGTAEEVADEPDSLKQLVAAFSRAATAERTEPLPPDDLFMKMATIMSKSCSVGEEDEEEEEGGGGESAAPELDAEEAAKQLEEDELAKQQLISDQTRLAERGVAEMVIQFIAASRGEMGDMVMTAINLGISLLTGGNVNVQSRMLQHLKDTKNVDFFQSIATLLEHCSVLDLDAFERSNKAQTLGMSTESNPELQNLHDQDSTCQLFRFLQLLCEGHNLDNQNYLRAQTGSNTSVNLIISTVDYLLRLQESIMDFYWYYSNKETIEESGRECFTKAIAVASQVFNTLTEFIQGPCVGNQLALAHSRLWDAVGGFLYIFAHMQDKLSKDADQIDLLKEFMGLQKDMMILLLSMLEGNVVNGAIGKQMVDTLAESTANVEMILKFFDIFLKMKDLTTSEAFMMFAKEGISCMTRTEMKQGLKAAKCYASEEIDYVMRCVDVNQDGKIDFVEFVDRFHNPAKEIGYNLAVLLTNLSEHIPNDARLGRLLEKAKSVLDYFEKYLGRIEIMGSANRIERVYFEISQNNIDQWEKPQIRESKRSFLHSAVNEGGDKEKLEVFVNFCEDTIFEMQHAASLSCEDQVAVVTNGDENADGEGASQSQDVSPGMMIFGVLRTSYDIVWFFIGLLLSIFSILTWSNVKYAFNTLTNMTLLELLLATLKLQLRLLLAVLRVIELIVKTFGLFIINMMRGPPKEEEAPPAAPSPPSDILSALAKSSKSSGGTSCPAPLPISNVDEAVEGDEEELAVFGVKMQKKGDGFIVTAEDQQSESGASDSIQPPKESNQTAVVAAPTAAKTLPKPRIFKDAPEPTAFFGGAVEEDKGKETKGVNYTKLVTSMLARNFYRFKFIALALTFVINVILLFSKVNQQVISPEMMEDAGGAAVLGDSDGSSIAAALVDEIANATESIIDQVAGSGGGVGDEDGGSAGAGAGEEEEPQVVEWVTISPEFSYLEPTLRVLALLHSCVAFALLIAYYHLKVPLVLFKREKDVSRRLEFDGLWITEQPADDDLKGHWDKLVLSTPSFPKIYWDKFVKKKVIAKYSEQFDKTQIVELLGYDRPPSGPSRLPSFLQNIDWQYLVWKWGAIFTDQSFLYIFFYFVLSVVGNFKYFAFACHLVDIAVSIKTLQTILLSVMQNGRQLVLTAMLLSVVVYFYTVIAFNFFRQFYVLGEDGEEKDAKCHDMLTCYAFHLYKGVRSGGGIGDEIESPDGSSVAAYRMIFDMSFFFFVIVILLAIMQGLIIDAFGELRDQLEQVREDLESKCFICGIGKDYFDAVPHGFEQHTTKEHNFANYMFFLMHLINKDDTEYTGQETYVWQLYQQRSWDFFPAGVCFRQQYEAELGLGGSSGGGGE